MAYVKGAAEMKQTMDARTDRVQLDALAKKYQDFGEKMVEVGKVPTVA